MFDIFDYLDKLENVIEKSSYIEATCPVCGKDNFKISKSNQYKGAYKCYSTGCSAKDIRKALSPNYVPDKYSVSPFKQKSRFNVEDLVKVQPVPLPDEIGLLDRIIQYNNTYHTGNKTYYYYDDIRRFVRVEFYKNNTRTSRHFWPEYRYKNSWLRGNGVDPWPLYANQELPDANTSNSLIMTEGEKCSNYIRFNLDLCCVTTHDWNVNKLSLLLNSVPSYIETIVYIKDSDTTGERKAQVVNTAANKVGLSCMILPVQLFKPDALESEDIADIVISRDLFIDKIINYHNQLAG